MRSWRTKSSGTPHRLMPLQQAVGTMHIQGVNTHLFAIGERQGEWILALMRVYLDTMRASPQRTSIENGPRDCCRHLLSTGGAECIEQPID